MKVMNAIMAVMLASSANAQSVQPTISQDNLQFRFVQCAVFNLTIAAGFEAARHPGPEVTAAQAGLDSIFFFTYAERLRQRMAKDYKEFNEDINFTLKELTNTMGVSSTSHPMLAREYWRSCVKLKKRVTETNDFAELLR